MPRAIDHLVFAARDLDAQAALFGRLGFQVGPRNRHPWGTRNHIVQFGTTFLELISTGPDFQAPVDPDPHLLSFPVFIHDYLVRREGFAMLALASEDARADQAAFKAAGIGDFDSFHFERQARSPDGVQTTVAFTLAFARTAAMPLAGFFTCRQHNPENFWNRASQIHPNGVTDVTGLVIVAENPADHAEFLSGFTGQREMLATSMGLDIRLARGQRIDVLTPQAAAFRMGCAAQGPAMDAQLAIACLQTSDLAALRACLEAGAIPHEACKDGIAVAPADAGGVGLVFAGANPA